jgi:integrase
VYGLELDDVSLERKTVTFRENHWRRLKTRGSQRIVPLWPQLEAILRDYLRGAHRPIGELLFPSLATGAEAMLTDTRKLLDHVAMRAGFWEYVVNPAGEPVKDKAGQPKRRGTVRTKALRHSYCAARLQTLDGGAPVSIYTVSRELGHTSPAMVQRVYAHLGTIRHRAEVVEYRVEQHADLLAERLTALQQLPVKPLL